MTTWTTVPLFGPNRWSSRSVLELHAPLESHHKSIASRGSVSECLTTFLDGGRFTSTHPLSIPCARQAITAMQRAEDFSSLWLAVAEWMSAMSGVPTKQLSPLVVPTPSPDQVLLPLEMEEELLSQRCFELAWEMLAELDRGEDYPIATKFRELFDYADDVRLGPSSRAILDAAVERGIPSYRLSNGSLVQLGEGIHQRRIWTAETDATSAIAESIASDKDLTKRLLRNVGVPVPLGRMVTSPEDAWAAAQEVGFPVVVKPCDANHQRGVSIELTEREEIEKAYHWAIEAGETTDILVEQFARGQHHRLLVVGDRMVAASRGHTETVVGDGQHTVAELVKKVNEDPRRGEAYTDPLGIVLLNATARIELSKQGLTVDSIPERDRRVLIQRTGDLTTDCTDAVHPVTAQQAVLAARIVGLDVAGLDVLATDISQPLAPQRGAVVEVNAGPSLTPHVAPLFGNPQPVGNAILELLFPSNRTSRIELIGLLGSSDAHEQSAALKQLLARPEWNGQCIGVLPHEDILVDGQRIPLGSQSWRVRAQAVLGHPSVEVMIVVIDPASFQQFGSPVPRLDRVVFTEAGASEWTALGGIGFWNTLQHALSPHAKLEFGAMAMELQKNVLHHLRRTHSGSPDRSLPS